MGAIKLANNARDKDVCDKISCLNTSINKMVDCVKTLEKMRSYGSVSTITEDDLKDVLKHMKELEESIEVMNNKKCSLPLFKAVGKGRKLWVSKDLQKKDSLSNTPSTMLFPG